MATYTFVTQVFANITVTTDDATGQATGIEVEVDGVINTDFVLDGYQLGDGEVIDDGEAWPVEVAAAYEALDRKDLPVVWTVADDPRVAQPGHKKDAANPDAPGRMEGAIRVTEEDALVLQGFPADYPIRGATKTSRFRQIGNAVPPPLAKAVLEVLVR